ncbi:MAG TPA: alpha/beta fold hydrolase [Roseiarcus sp.]|nr:alpha/beta fold hydrolase [Roseiarcus sp.]
MRQSKSEITPFASAGVRGFLHSPEKSIGRGIVLTHGAGSDCNAPLLVKLANALTAAGFTVLRCDLPFRQERRRGLPTPAKSAADRAGLKAAATLLGALVRGDTLLGGHSYGGRQASMLAADEPGLASGLLLLSYPLHPPKKPDEQRVQHFPRIGTPCLFVHGTADPFGSIAELESATATIPAPKRLVAIEGAGHDLGGARFDPRLVIDALRAEAALRSSPAEG